MTNLAKAPNWPDSVKDAAPEEIIDFTESSSPASKAGPSSAQSKPKFRLLTVEDLMNLPDPEWLIADILPKDALCVLYGEPGTGKSFLALDWANCIASEETWLGRATKGGEVVYIYAEGASGLNNRVAAWCKVRGAQLDGLRFLPHELDVSTKTEVKEFIKTIESAALEPALVIIDTLARCFGAGEENTAKDMNAFVNGAELIRAAFEHSTVLIVHHTGKDTRKGERGSTALNAAVNTSIFLKKKEGALAISCEKQKDAEEFDDIPVTLRTVNLEGPNRSCVVEMLPVAAKCSKGKVADTTYPKPGSSDMTAFKALSEVGPHSASYTEWRVNSGLAKSTFKDCRKRLLEKGLVVSDGPLYRVTDEGTTAGTGPDTAGEANKSAA